MKKIGSAQTAVAKASGQPAAARSRESYAKKKQETAQRITERLCNTST